ncbi:hypothetical protein IV203_012843 [Nitzschia inconspicua]|uniref:Uncharacterized protein n=1 Tax=Nitzschia inconspicua TaxID=303405 RepID=A0A9K3M3W0_9STRA|nr:hypothetical protein IV203_012843 [Nitzschia inconspicua]
MSSTDPTGVGEEAVKTKSRQEDQMDLLYDDLDDPLSIVIHTQQPLAKKKKMSHSTTILSNANHSQLKLPQPALPLPQQQQQHQQQQQQQQQQLQEENTILKQNMGILFRTAKREIQRKDARIQQLEQQLLQLHKQTQNRQNQQEPT